MVVVPLAAFRFLAVHQQACFAAHLAVEKLHAIGFAPVRPARELIAAGNEAIIVTDMDRHVEALAPVQHHFPHAPFARFSDNHFTRAMAFYGPLKLGCERTRVGRIVQLDVIDSDALPAQ